MFRFFYKLQKKNSSPPGGVNEAIVPLTQTFESFLQDLKRPLASIARIQGPQQTPLALKDIISSKISQGQEIVFLMN